MDRGEVDGMKIDHDSAMAASCFVACPIIFDLYGLWILAALIATWFGLYKWFERNKP